MAPILSQSLTPFGRFLLRRVPRSSPPAVALSQVCFSRHYSSKTKLIEIDLDSISSRSEPGAESDAAILKMLNDMVRRIIVQKATPDWLPFVPGSSFWVPPPRNSATKMVDLIDKVTNQLTEEESLSLLSSFGWPCSSAFLIPPPGIVNDRRRSPQQVEEEEEFEILKNMILEANIDILLDSYESSKPGNKQD